MATPRENADPIATRLKWHAYVPCRNRPDLLRRALQSIAPIRERVLVIDNTDGEPLGLDGGWSVHRTLPCPWPLTMVLNWMMHDAQARDLDFYFWMHNDNAFTDDTGIGDFLRLAEAAFRNDAAVGCVRLHDRTGVAFRVSMNRQVGWYDISWPDYFSDWDYYMRMDRLRWSVVTTQALRGRWIHGVDGRGSQTLENDLHFKHKTTTFWQSYVAWYREKWGGCPAEGTVEHFHKPFAGKFGERSV